MKSNPDLTGKYKNKSPVRGLKMKMKVLDYSPAPSRETTQKAKMKKDVAVLRQKEAKIGKKLKMTQNENIQLGKIKKKTEENISKQKKMIDHQIDNVIEVFVKMVREGSVYLDLGRDYQIEGEGYKYPPDEPVDRRKEGSFRLPTHLTSSCVDLREGRSNGRRKNSISRSSSKSIGKGVSGGRRSRSPLSRKSRGMMRKSLKSSQKSLDMRGGMKSRSPRRKLRKSATKGSSVAKRGSGANGRIGQNGALDRSKQLNTHMKKFVLSKTVFMPSSLRALARTVESKY